MQCWTRYVPYTQTLPVTRGVARLDGVPTQRAHRYTHLLPLVPESPAKDFLRKLRIAGVQALPTGM